MEVHVEVRVFVFNLSLMIGISLHYIDLGLKKSTMLTSSEERSSPAVLNDGK